MHLGTCLVPTSNANIGPTSHWLCWLREKVHRFNLVFQLVYLLIISYINYFSLLFFLRWLFATGVVCVHDHSYCADLRTRCTPLLLPYSINIAVSPDSPITFHFLICSLKRPPVIGGRLALSHEMEFQKGHAGLVCFYLTQLHPLPLGLFLSKGLLSKTHRFLCLPDLGVYTFYSFPNIPTSIRRKASKTSCYTSPDFHCRNRPIDSDVLG